MDDPHDRYRADVAAYALGALSEIEQASLERHLDDCSSCSRDLERFRAVIEPLSVTVPPERARRELKQEMLQRIRASDAGSDLRRTFHPRMHGRLALRRPTFAVEAAVACVVLAAGGYVLGSVVSGESRQELRAVVDVARAHGVRATLERKGDLGVLRTSNLAPLHDGVYVVWVDRGDGASYVSSFNVGPGGTAEAGISRLEGVERVMVTTEATARVSRPTSSPILTISIQ